MSDILEKISNSGNNLIFTLNELLNNMGFLEDLVLEKGKPFSNNVYFIFIVVRFGVDNNLMLGKYSSYGFHYELYEDGSSWINLQTGETIIIPEAIPTNRILLIYKNKYLFVDLAKNENQAKA